MALLEKDELLTEREDMARRRGEKIVDILVGLGVPQSSIGREIIDAVAEPTDTADWQDVPVPAQMHWV